MKGKLLDYIDKLPVYVKEEIMPVIRAADAVAHDLHNARFTSYARPGTGSAELCLWRVELQAESTGAGHRIHAEEVFVIVEGAVELAIDGEVHSLQVGDVAVVPAGASIGVDNAATVPAVMWVSTRVGFSAEMADGTPVTPPWVG
jgi:quercetin dioxygenase-like cupin family protein